MFERFSSRSRRVVVHAQEEARARHHHYIGTEHLLLGLVREPRGMGASVLRSLGATEDQVRDRLGHYLPTVEAEDAPSGHIPFTPRAKRVLELGLREALQLGHDIIGTEHLLLALIREEDGLAGQALHDLGVRLDAVRNEVLTRHPPGLTPPGTPPGAPSGAPGLGPRLLRAEVESLRLEVERLRALLRRHDIDPGEESAP
jgi:ATP-dependent Clp protease ATP-binding subunit ClpC